MTFSIRSTLLSGLAIGALALAAAGTSAQAETLRGALAKAYENNPQLSAARAGQRAIDENVPLAKADGRPNLAGQGSYQETVKAASPSVTAPDRVATGSVRFSVPIYQGGGVKNSVRAARERAEAGQADLRSTEAQIFAQVVSSYMNVIRDQAVVALNRNNVAVLRTNLQAARDRFEIGDLTRTDVAQSEARLAIADSQQQSAEANLISSREQYVSLVGEAPVDLEAPPVLPNMPAASDGAVDVALSSNPDLEAAARAVDASAYDVRVARSSRLPQLAATADASYSDFLGSAGSLIPTIRPDQNQSSAGAGVTLTIPLFQGGRPAALIRQSQARNSQAIEGLIATERGVIAQTRALYASWRASLQVIESTQQAVAANTLSLEGVRAENSVGTRSILDILNAEQELLDSQVRLVTAERDSYVAGFNLLVAMGKAEARDLGLDGGPLYDPAVNLDRVDGKVSDWDTDPKPVPQATRTVDVPAQTATAPDIARPSAGMYSSQP